MKRINPTRSEGVDGDVFERLLADIRGHIFEHNNIAKLAEVANLSTSTVSNLAYGKTKSPHMRTVTQIMEALGKADPVLEAFKSKKPVWTKQAQARLSTRARLKKERADKIHPHRAKNADRSSTRRGIATMH